MEDLSSRFGQFRILAVVVSLAQAPYVLANISGSPCSTPATFEQITRPISEARKIVREELPLLGREAPTSSNFKKSIDKLCETYKRQNPGTPVPCSYKELLKGYKMLTQAGASRRKDVLSKDEGLAIFIYTKEYYTLINAILDNKDQISIHLPYLQMLNFALRKLPVYVPPEGKVYRKGSNDRKYTEGEQIYHNGLRSFSNNKEAALLFRGNNLYEVVSKSGRDVSRYSAKPHEGEVLFLPQTKFRVEKVVPATSPRGDNTIFMTEISEDEPADPVEYRAYTFH